MADFPKFCRTTDDGIAVFVRLTPRSARDALEGVVETADGRDHLKARVRAVPKDGKANQALEKLLAGQLGVPASAVSVTGGATARLKTVQIAGDRDALCDRLRALVSNSR